VWICAAPCRGGPLSFEPLGLIEPLRRALADVGHTHPTPIQAQAIPPLLAGRDVCGTAQTGTGKTAAFALPILQRLAARPGAGPVRALVLAPTRELAVQIREAFSAYGRDLPGLRCTVVFGGMKLRAQRRAMEEGTDILVATPGRLLDLMGQGVVRLGGVEVFVLDEADRMLDMGFLADVRRVVRALPAHRQTALFSATVPRDIEQLAAQVLQKPVRVSVAAPAAPAVGVRQQVWFVEPPAKRELLLSLLGQPDTTRVMVFVRTRHGADKLVGSLRVARVRADALHADRPQPDRLAALAAFARGDLRVLVATEIASRGLDVEGVTHVVNYDLPNVPESYVHRIGRTARAGAVGVAVSFCAAAERGWLADIEALTGQRLERMG